MSGKRFTGLALFVKFGAVALLVMSLGCANRDSFTRGSYSQAFAQDYNPENIDVLWVIDDRSPMFYAQDHLVSEASKFFKRLDEASRDYQMAFVSMDMEIAHGELKPKDSPIILRKKVGTQEQRVNLFGNLISNIINLRTGATNKGFEAARVALTYNFKSRENVPLVIVFISYGDDRSAVPSGDAVDHFEAEFLKLKQNRKDLLRVYSVNYLPLAAGEQPNESNRCAARYNADIDNAGFENRYFKLAERFGGSAQVTADLCGSFANQINLAGIRLKELRSRFKLDVPAVPESVRVTVTRNGGKDSLSVPWKYDAQTQEVVFETAPPEGTTIAITYHPRL